jgi:hypothetical protein
LVVLVLASVSNSDVQNAATWMSSSKSVGLNGILSFVLKGCFEIFVPVLQVYF